jgi:hypothetical protein
MQSYRGFFRLDSQSSAIVQHGVAQMPVALSDWRATPRWQLELRLTPGSVHTPTMTLKAAALLALIGTILMTALLMWTFVLTFLNVLRDLVPPVTLFQSFIYAFGCFSVAVFFYVFHRAQ